MDSSRLPGKSLADIGGRPLLGRVIDRARMVGGETRIVMATSARPIDDPIAELAACEGLELFRGSTNDVLGRADACSQKLRLEQLARICGDSPFFSPGLIRQFISDLIEFSADIVTNTMPRSFPEGASAEVVSASALKRAATETHDPEDREHVTKYLYSNPDRFSIRNHRTTSDYKGVKLAVDLPEDLERARWIIGELGAMPEKAELDEITDLARQWQTQHYTTNKMEQSP